MSEIISLSEYGKPIAEYRGRGILTLDNGQPVDCSFVAGQLSDGLVLILCEFRSTFYASHNSARSFRGETTDGYRIFTEYPLEGYSFLPEIHQGWPAAFHTKSLVVEPANASGNPRTVHFGLTNFEFTASEPDEARNSLLFSLVLRNGNNVTRLQIVPVPNYDRVVEYVRVLRTTDVTCEAVIQIGSQFDLAAFADVIDNLSHLMSVARGTKVQWVYRALHDQSGALVKCEHHSRITRHYGPLSIIDGTWEQETKYFLENQYSSYVERRAPYMLDRGMISAYLESKAEDDLIERRSIKLSVAVEMLKSAFIEQVGLGVNEFIIPRATFESLIPQLRSSMRQTLDAAGIVPQFRDSILSNRKLRGLNRGPDRRSFSRILRELCEHIGLQVDEAQLRMFVACRNSLIHTGRFYCATASIEDRWDCEPPPSVRDEYFFLVSFVDRIFLKLLRYTGPYRDWRTGSAERRELA